MHRTEPALGQRRCAGDGAPKVRCTLAASAQCLHEIRRRVNMDLYEDGRCARHATFNISAVGMDIMRMLIMQVLFCIRSDELELRYATAGALAGTTNRLYADCNSGFEVRYRSVPMVQSGYTITH